MDKHEQERVSPVKVADDLFETAFGWRPGGSQAATSQAAASEECPPWCTGHDGPMHKTGRAVMGAASDDVSLRVLGMRFTGIGTKPEVAVHATWFNPAGAVLDSDLYMTPDDARRVAALAEILSHATPEQLLRLPDAIRFAAAQITEADDGEARTLPAQNEPNPPGEH